MDENPGIEKIYENKDFAGIIFENKQLSHESWIKNGYRELDKAVWLSPASGLTTFRGLAESR
jgi:hypothetical protein